MIFQANSKKLLRAKKIGLYLVFSLLPWKLLLKIAKIKSRDINKIGKINNQMIKEVINKLELLNKEVKAINGNQKNKTKKVDK